MTMEYWKTLIFMVSHILCLIPKVPFVVTSLLKKDRLKINDRLLMFLIICSSIVLDSLLYL